MVSASESQSKGSNASSIRSLVMMDEVKMKPGGHWSKWSVVVATGQCCCFEFPSVL